MMPEKIPNEAYPTGPVSSCDGPINQPVPTNIHIAGNDSLPNNPPNTIDEVAWNDWVLTWNSA